LVWGEHNLRRPGQGQNGFVQLGGGELSRHG